MLEIVSAPFGLVLVTRLDPDGATEKVEVAV